MHRKKEKPIVLWSINTKLEESSNPSPFSFYEIHRVGKYFSVKYYGACEIYKGDTLKDAKEYVYNRLRSDGYTI